MTCSTRMQPRLKSASTDTLYSTMAKVTQLSNTTKGLGMSHVEPRRITTDMGDRIGFITTSECAQSSSVFTITEDLAVSSIDAEKQAS